MPNRSFDQLFTRSQVCSIFHIKLDTLRHYEQLSLITPIVKENGYKYYSIEMIELLNVILTFRKYDMALPDIQQLLETEDVHAYSIQIEQQKNHIQERIRELQSIQSSLELLSRLVHEFEAGKDQIVEEFNFRFPVRLFHGNIASSDNVEQFLTFNQSEQGNTFLNCKIVDTSWVASNRENLDHMSIGPVTTSSGFSYYDVAQALRVYTYLPMDEIPTLIQSIWSDYGSQYDFEDRVIILEINAYRCFNQGALIRKIMLPYHHKK
ncbi:MAG: MerR family transcriptional regulator [Erysipelotrichaceae bacterium]